MLCFPFMSEPQDPRANPTPPQTPSGGGAWLPPRLREKIEEAEAGGGSSGSSAVVGWIITVVVIALVGAGVWWLIRSGQEKEKARLAAEAAAAAAQRAEQVADSLAVVHRADSLAAVARADSIAFTKLPKSQQRKILAERAKKAGAAGAAATTGSTTATSAPHPAAGAGPKPAGAAASGSHGSKAPDSSATEPPAPHESGPFGIDAGQFLDQARATQVADDLKAKAGMAAQVVTAGEGDAATYHVYVGKFATRAAAEAAAMRLLAKGLVEQGVAVPLPKAP